MLALRPDIPTYKGSTIAHCNKEFEAKLSQIGLSGTSWINNMYFDICVWFSLEKTLKTIDYEFRVEQVSQKFRSQVLY